MAENAMLAMFMALFAITAPIAAVPLFVAATEGQSEVERRRTALIAAGTYVFACLVALFTGNAALSFFGVSVAALRLAGMAVVAVIGWQMINAPTAIAEPVGPDSRRLQHPHRASRRPPRAHAAQHRCHAVGFPYLCRTRRAFSHHSVGKRSLPRIHDCGHRHSVQCGVIPASEFSGDTDHAHHRR